MRSRSTLAALALLIVTAIWGATFVVIQDVIESMEIFAFLTWRFGLAGLALLVIRPQSLKLLSARDVRRGVGLGLMLGGAYVAQTLGLQYTSATVAGFITGMFVVFTPLIAAVALGRRIDRNTWLAVALATVGLALISLRGFSIGAGELLVLLCAIGFAAQLVFLGEWTSPSKAYGLTVIQLLTVAIGCGALSFLRDGPQPPQSSSAWLAVAFLALIATAAAYLTQSWAQIHITSTRAAIILTMEPVFAGVFGVLVAGDLVTWQMAIGGLMILAAMYLVELTPRNRRVEPSPHP